MLYLLPSGKTFDLTDDTLSDFGKDVIAFTTKNGLVPAIRLGWLQDAGIEKPKSEYQIFRQKNSGQWTPCGQFAADSEEDAIAEARLESGDQTSRMTAEEICD